MGKFKSSQLQKYLDIAGSFMISIDREHKITYINRRGAEILDRSIDSVIGKDYFDLCVAEHKRENSRKRFSKLFDLPMIRANNFEGKILTKKWR